MALRRTCQRSVEIDDDVGAVPKDPLGGVDEAQTFHSLSDTDIVDAVGLKRRTPSKPTGAAARHARTKRDSIGIVDEGQTAHVEELRPWKQQSRLFRYAVVQRHFLHGAHEEAVRHLWNIGIYTVVHAVCCGVVHMCTCFVVWCGVVWCGVVWFGEFKCGVEVIQDFMI